MLCERVKGNKWGIQVYSKQERYLNRQVANSISVVERFRQFFFHYTLVLNVLCENNLLFLCSLSVDTLFFGCIDAPRATNVLVKKSQDTIGFGKYVCVCVWFNYFRFVFVIFRLWC